MDHAGEGERLVIESRMPSGRRQLFRVVSSRSYPALPPLDQGTDVVVERVGGSGLVVGATVFVWLFAGFLALVFDGTFQDTGPGPASLGAIVVFSVGALAVTTFRHRKLLSRGDSAVHSDLACLGLRRRRSVPFARLSGVTLVHTISPGGSGSPGRSQIHERTHEIYIVVLRGAEDVALQQLGNPFAARRRAEQIAAYVGLPVIEPEVDPAVELPEYRA